MQMAGAAKSRQAMESARAQGMAKQKEFQRQAETVVNKSMTTAGRDTAEKDMAQGQAARLQAIEAATKATQPMVGVPLDAAGGTGNRVVSTPTDRARTATQDAGNAWARVQAGNAARIGSYNDWASNRAVENADASQRLAVTSNLARGQANLLPLQLEAASHAGDSLSGIGSMLGTVGSAVGMGVGTGMIGGGGAPAGTTIGTNPFTGYSYSYAPGANPWQTIKKWMPR